MFRQPKAVWAVAFACVISFMGIGLVDPILASLRTKLHASPSQVELLFTSYLVVTAVAMLVTGWVSSRIGPRRTLLAGLGLVVAFALLAGLSGSIGGIVGFRAGWGLGNALFIATALSVIVGAVAVLFVMITGGTGILGGGRRDRAAKAWRGLSIAFAFVMLMLAIRVYLGRFENLFEDHTIFAGVTYTEAHVTLTGMLVVSNALAIGAGLALINAVAAPRVRRGWLNQTTRSANAMKPVLIWSDSAENSSDPVMKVSTSFFEKCDSPSSIERETSSAIITFSSRSACVCRT